MNCLLRRTLLSFAVSACMMLTLEAQDNNTEKAVSYLTSQQATDGSWGTDDKLKLVDSSECFQALLRVNGGEDALNKSL